VADKRREVGVALEVLAEVNLLVVVAREEW